MESKSGMLSQKPYPRLMLIQCSRRRKYLLSKYTRLLLLLLLLFLPVLLVAVVVGEEVVAAEAVEVGAREVGAVRAREQVQAVVLPVLLLLLLCLLLFLPLVVVELVRAEVEEVGAGAGELVLEELVLAVLLEVLLLFFLEVLLLFFPLPEMRLQEILAAALVPRKSDSLKRSTQAAAGLLAYFPCCPTTLTSTLLTDARMKRKSGNKLESLYMLYILL